MDKRSKTSKSNLGSYTQPKWKLGKTVAIRIPESIKKEVLEFARKIDSNQGGAEEQNDSIEEAIKILKWAVAPKSKGGGYDGRRTKELRDRVSKVIALLEKKE